MHGNEYEMGERGERVAVARGFATGTIMSIFVGRYTAVRFLRRSYCIWWLGFASDFCGFSLSTIITNYIACLSLGNKIGKRSS